MTESGDDGVVVVIYACGSRNGSGWPRAAGGARIGSESTDTNGVVIRRRLIRPAHTADGPKRLDAVNGAV